MIVWIVNEQQLNQNNNALHASINFRFFSPMFKYIFPHKVERVKQQSKFISISSINLHKYTFSDRQTTLFKVALNTSYMSLV